MTTNIAVIAFSHRTYSQWTADVVMTENVVFHKVVDDTYLEALAGIDIHGIIVLHDAPNNPNYQELLDALRAKVPHT